MWFLPARKTRRTPITRSPRGSFRPRLEGLEDRCLMSAGALDTTFGNGGLVSAPSSIPYTSSVVVQPADGKIVAGGYSLVPGTTNTYEFALVRYNANGSLDGSFGSNGIVTTAVGGRGNSYINGLAFQGDGKIVAVGSTLHYGSKSKSKLYDAFVVVRYNTDGSLDKSFGNSGIVLTNVGVAASPLPAGYTTAPGAKAVTIQVDGKIVVAGGVNTGTIANFAGDNEFAVARYNSNGSPDTGFGSGGLVLTPQFDNNPDEASSLAIQADGKIILAGATYKFAVGVNYAPIAIALARYTATGQQDSSFGTGGIVTGLTPSGYTACALGVLVESNTNGAIVVSGFAFLGSTQELVLARLSNAGQLDTAFGDPNNPGFAVNMNMVRGGQIFQGPNGDLLTAGTAGVSGNTATYVFGVAAYLPGGTPDTTFGTGGVASAPHFSSGSSDRGRALAIQTDGKIVVAGYTSNGSGTIALARFLPPDTKIGSFTANQLTAGSPVTLTASNIMNSNPTSYIAQVAFYYLDINNNVVSLGIVFSTSTQASYSVSTSLAPGSYTLYAVATDSNGVLSDPLAIPSFTVI